MQKKILGLDICERAISVVLIQTGLRENKLLFCQQLPLAQTHGDNFQQVFELIERIAQSIPVSWDVSAISLPSGMISFRNLETPFKDPQKIRQILPFELEPTLPSPPEQLVMDFFLTEHNETNHLIVASLNRDTFDTYLDKLSNAGFNPSLVSFSGYASVNSLIHHHRNLPEQSMVLHLDSHTLTLFELIFQKVVLIRSFKVPTSGNSRIEAIAANLQQTLAGSGEILSQDFYPQHMWLTGNDNPFDRISEFLAEKLHIPNSTLDIGSLYNLSFKDGISKKDAVSFNNALGLACSEKEALGGFNFRKGPLALKSHWTENKAAVVRTGMIACLALIMFFFTLFLENRFLQNRLESLNQEIRHIFTSAFPEVTRIVDPVHQMQSYISESENEKQMSGYNPRSSRAVDILNEVSKKITNDDVELTQLILGPENLQLSGTAATFNTVNEIRNQLEPVLFFKKIMISSANVDRLGERIQFKLNIDL